MAQLGLLGQLGFLGQPGNLAWQPTRVPPGHLARRGPLALLVLPEELGRRALHRRSQDPRGILDQPAARGLLAARGQPGKEVRRVLQVLAVQPAQLDLLEPLGRPAVLDVRALRAAPGAPGLQAVWVLRAPLGQRAQLVLEDRRATVKMA